ncbi:papilin-like [Rhopilema esculentum]|uniref:papilin-like n=1 Tax=Rhopilema esculentum TaxID=499914 RepID=UPI0031DE559A
MFSMGHRCALLYLMLLALVVAAKDGKWTSWSDWSRCSRSCGVGVSFQTRSCLNRTGSLTLGCDGLLRQNRLCNIQDCPAEDVDFRSVQCAAYNSKPYYNGKKFEWVPVKRDAFPCELTCMPKRQRFFVKFSDKVTDGTPCREGSLDVCIEGKCERVGCDLVLNSTATFDKCRECNGRNTKCRLVKGVFELKQIEADYIEMLRIPARTTTIFIKEEGDLNNYIALKNYKGEYILNGDWTINRPGKYKLNGHYAVYERSNKEHSLKIDGPIDAPLTIETLALKAPVRFSYEYYVPNELGNNIPTTTYRWTVEKRSECSASCAGGVRYKKVVCVASNNGRTVSELLCNSDERPASEEECNMQPCPAHWFVGEWSSCSTSCGIGEKVRRVHCVREAVNGQTEMLPYSRCKGNRPAKTEKCSVKQVCPQWKADAWSECSKTCGPGVKTRRVKCIGIANYASNTLEEGSCDTTIKPVNQEGCDLGSCNLTWVAESWSQCSAHCGKGMRNRHVTCQNSERRVFPDGFCDSTFKPTAVEDCLVPGPCQPMWYATQWSKCSRDCGYGIQVRMVYCAEKIAGNLRILDSSNCKSAEKPSKMKKCHQLKPCISQYFASLWKPCSASCGTGLRLRKVRCYADSRIDYSEETCKHLKKPASVGLCNRHSCSGKNVEDVKSVVEVVTKAPKVLTTKVVVKATTGRKSTQRKPTEKVTQRPTTKRTTTEKETQPPPTKRTTTEELIQLPPTKRTTTEELIQLPSTKRTPTEKVTQRLTTQGIEPPTTEVKTTQPPAKPTTVKVKTEKQNPRHIKAIIISFQGPESIDEGSTVDYYCNSMGEPIPQISWTFNGKPVDKLGDRFLLLNGNSHLVITNVLKSDIGELVCSASNVAGFETRSMDIKVTSPPSVAVAPAIADLKEGNSFFTTCDVTAYPAAKITWRKDGRKFLGDSSRVFVADTMIRFKSLVIADSGNYECYAENSVGYDRKTMFLNVQPNQQVSSCVDDPDRANCVIIKQFNLCTHQFYSAACCKTCSGK